MKKRIVKLFSAFTSKESFRLRQGFGGQVGHLRGGTKSLLEGGSLRKGFTLIELLIVIAVLGILVTGILVVLNPVEQTRRASDAQRASSISQLATAITAYSTSQLLQNYTPLADGSWQTTLLNAGEIKNLVSVPLPAGSNCSSRVQQNICQTTTTSTDKDITIWAILDSTAEKTRGGCTTSNPVAIVAYISSQQKTGIGCITGVTATVNFAGTSILDVTFPLK